MNPVNGFTPEGLPTLLLSNMPVQSAVRGLSVTRPEIYFGEMTNTDVYVKTRQTVKGGVKIDQWGGVKVDQGSM
jgi:hypothetical protein